MNRHLFTIFTIIILIFFLRSCIKADKPEELANNKIINNYENIIYPENNKNITLNGVDYLQSQAPAGKYGGELILSIIGEGPKTFNPCNSKDATSSEMAGILYDGLVTTHYKTGEIIPKLAKKFVVNGTEYTIYLRKGLKWSDGKPISADDIMYTYNEIVFKGLGNTSAMQAMMIDGQLPKLEKIDDYTVKFSTPKPFAPFLRQLSYPIVPKHYFKPYSDKGASSFNSFLNPNTPPDKIVSSGAFTLKEYVPAQRVVFERNNNYYEVNTLNQKLPYLDKLIYLIVGDTNNEILKFEAKEIDTIALKGDGVARYKQKEATSDYTIYNLGPSTGTMFIAINLNNRKDADGNYFVNPVKQRWLRDKNFRKAIDYAIDRKSMVQNVAFGVAEPLFTAESLNSIYLNKNIKGYNSDKNKALQLLKESGFEYKNNKLYDKSGNLVELDLYTNAGNLEREAIGVMIKQDLEDIGIKVNFKPVEFNSLVYKLTGTYDWDMVIMGLTGSPLEPHDGKNVWTSNGPLHLFNQRDSKTSVDDLFPWEKELDDIFEQAALKLSTEERKLFYNRYQEIIAEEKPLIYLYSPTRIVAVRKKLKNIYPTSLSGYLHNIEEIYIDNN